MKRIFLATFLVLALCSVLFAQNNENPKIEGDPVDRFGKISYNDTIARLDPLFSQIENDPASKALIVIQFDKKDARNYKISHLRNIYKIINKRKYDLSRTLFIVSEKDFEETVLWVVPQGAELPEINSENDQMIEGKELRQKLGNLFRKN